MITEFGDVLTALIDVGVSTALFYDFSSLTFVAPLVPSNIEVDFQYLFVFKA